MFSIIMQCIFDRKINLDDFKWKEAQKEKNPYTKIVKDILGITNRILFYLDIQSTVYLVGYAIAISATHIAHIVDIKQ